MPHLPDTSHETHDLELVAAHAAGDAGGADLERALALVAACPECAALHRDLRAIAAALPAMPPPVRPRDFSLSPEQAASLRRRGLRGLLAAFSGPRFAFATPLGTGLAALGIVGILVASGGITTGGATSAPAEVAQEAASSAAGLAAPDVVAGGNAAGAAPMAAASMAPASMAAGEPLPSAADEMTLKSDASAAPAPAVDDGARTGLAAGTGETTPSPVSTGTPSPVVPLAGLLLLAGLALVAARLVAVRLARDP